jgi:hypothetical protein
MRDGHRHFARLEQAARASHDWNTDAERESVLDQIARARGELERRRAEAAPWDAGR